MKLLYLGAGALTAAVAALVIVLSTAGCGSAHNPHNPPHGYQQTR